MNDSSQISYWYDEDCILTVPTHKVPTIGEEMHFDTRMDENWYDARFPNRKLFREGIRGTFSVTQVKRYYKCYDTVFTQKTEDGDWDLPTQRTVEEFEVYLEKIK